jgi:hypothetical protein
MALGMSGCFVASIVPGGLGSDRGVVAVLRGMMGAPDHAAAIGRACLEAELVSPAAVQAFVTALGHGVADGRTVADRFHRRRAADFADGRLHSLRGWQLAESESLAFAAVALS